MEKLYYQVPYVKEFQAVVTSCKEGNNHNYQVVLDRTGFYPEGGGQPSDTGTLGDATVMEVHEKDGVVWHQVDKLLAEGTTVTGIIDWEKRYSNMQQHSGEHLLSGLIHQHYGYDNVGFHMGNEEVTIDFNGPLTMNQLEEMEQEANRILYDNRPVIETFPTEEVLHKLEYRSKKELTGDIRIIEIPGGDRCACCGTHVQHTGEIGIIKVLGMMNYKGGVRVTMLCGMKALLDYERKQSQVTKISHLLSAKPGLIVEAVEKLKQEQSQKDVLLIQLYHRLFREKIVGLADTQAPLLLFEEGLTPMLLRQFCTMLYEAKKGNTVMVCSGEDGSYQYAIGSVHADMRAVSKALGEELHGKGGGSALMAQGTFVATREEIENAWKEQCEVREWI